MDDEVLRSPFLRAFGLLLALLGLAPLLVLLRAPGADLWSIAAPLVLCFICYPISLMPKRMRIFALIPLCLMCGACGYMIVKSESMSAAQYVYAAICLCAPLFALPSLFREQLYVEISVGIAAMLIGWILLRNPDNGASRALVMRLATVYLPLMLLYVNMEQLQKERRAQRGGKISGMRPANILLTCVIAAGAFVLASAGRIWQWIKVAAETIIGLFVKLLAMPLQQFEDEAAVEASDEMMYMPPAEAQEPSIILKILEVFMYVAGAALLLWGLVLLIKKLPSALRTLRAWLMQALKRYIRSISAEGGDYTDTSESLSAGEGRVSARRRRKSRRAPRWSELDNRRRVRAAYRLAVADSARANKTASENLTMALSEAPDAARELAQSYDRARYSEHEISDAEAETAREILKAVK